MSGEQRDGIGMRRIAGVARRFGGNASGTITVYAAVALTVLFCGCGLAVDMARGFLLKSRLSNAVDAAAMAGGAMLADTTRRDDVARSYFVANLTDDTLGATIPTPDISYSNGDTEITVTASATLPTTMLRLVGIENLTVAATATATQDNLIGPTGAGGN